ncbi:ADP-ribose pyrophosphatase [Vibrio chagasii]|nr:ADP-ribose pyrophosphatase [Vibrio chagasii]
MINVENTLFKNGFMNVREVTSPITGTENKFVTFGRNKTKTGAIIVPITPDEKVMLVKEYRIGGDVFTISVPKGAADSVGESAVSIAERELSEELGAEFDSISETNMTAYPLPAFADFYGQVVFAHGVRVTGNSALEAGEVIELYGEFTKAEVFKMLQQGQINDAEGAMALQAWLLSAMSEDMFK